MRWASSVKVPGEIKRSRDLKAGREVELDLQVSPEEIMSREVELGCESWISFASSCSSTAMQRTLSLWLCPSTAVETAIAQCTHKSHPFPSSVPAEAGCLFAVAACVHVFISGESLHCFLVGVIKSYDIATSDLWLFISYFQPASLASHPAPLHVYTLIADIHTNDCTHSL